MPSQRVQHHGGKGGLPQRSAAPRRDQTGFQIAGKIGEILNVLGPAPLSTQLDKKHSAKYPRQDTDRSAGLPQVRRIGKAQIGEAAAHCRRCAVPAGEASRQQKTKAVVDFRPKLRDYQNGEGGHQAVLNHLGHHLIGQVGAHSRHLAGGAALPHGKTVDTHRSKDNHNKHGGIGPN